MNEWVVTYRIDHSQGFSIIEFFRGSEEECRRIKNRFGGGSNDKDKKSPWDRTNTWTAIIGPVSDWEEFLGEDDVPDLT